MWWFGDSLGMLAMAPALLAWWPGADPQRSAPGGRSCWLLLLAALVLLAALLMFTDGLIDRHAVVVAPLVLLSLFVWMATQADLRMLTLTGLLVGLCATLRTVSGQGPFADPHTTMAVLRLQAFLFTLYLTSLGLWTLLHELHSGHAARQLLHRAIESLGEGVVLSDARRPDLPVIYVNPKFEQMTGYGAAEVMGRNCRFLQGDEHDQPGLTTLRQAIQAGEPAQVLLRNYRKDGHLFLNELTLAPVFDEHRQLSAFVGVQRDVTALHHGQEELRQTRDQLARINLDLAARIADRVRELEHLNLLLAEQAHTDALTGVANRRHFHELLLREMARCDRSGHVMCLAMFDIDHFKAINDQHGHAAGDQALVGMTRAVKALLRSGDILARLGGEEFGLLLPETALAEALIVAERLRQAVADLSLSHEAVALHFTISIGLVRHEPGESTDTLIKRADQRMYAAKQSGRNQVMA
jgi:diguanylate cyclase (GGDEF)-like protein/PAS domain S-box-containing protein